MSADPTVVQPRVIVLCFDGTSNQYGATNTNVVKFHGTLDKSRPLEQIVYYQPGVGTYFNPGVVSPLFTWLAKIADEAFAWYLDEHVREGYKFLMQNYRTGDKICLFGFSRGAYTARALAGLLDKIGLLPRDNNELISFAYTLYTRTDKAGLDLAAGFKGEFCTPVSIDFVGVWDTVGSVGLIYSRDLPFTSANSAVRVFRHALSLDEHRARFQPNLFHREAPKEVKEKSKLAKLWNVIATRLSRVWGERRNSYRQVPILMRLVIPEVIHGLPSNPQALSPERELTAATSSAVPGEVETSPDTQEVWFAGCHADVGGGAVKDGTPNILSFISLEWMVKEVKLSGCGIIFDKPLRRVGASETISRMLPTPSGQDGSGEDMAGKGKGKSGEAQTSSQDEVILADIHDKLKTQPLWWLLELMPMRFMRQNGDGTKQWFEWRINFWRGRRIESDRPNFHKSVERGIANDTYKPKAKWARGTEQYVE